MRIPPLQNTALVLGGTGGFGGAMVAALNEEGQKVRIFARNPGRAEQLWSDAKGVEIVAGDVQDRSALLSAAENCSLIVHGINYPCEHWVPFMHTATINVIAAAQTTAATVLFPGTIFGFDHSDSGPLAEAAPMLAQTKKALLRIRLETQLREATLSSTQPLDKTTNDEQKAKELAGQHSHDNRMRLEKMGQPIRVLVLRGNNFFGPTVRNGLAGQIFSSAAKQRRAWLFGSKDTPREWVYLPDLAQIGVRLLRKSELLSSFEVFHIRGHVLASQSDFALCVSQQARAPTKPRIISWPLIHLISLFDPHVRELLELRCLLESPITLDDSKLRRMLPDVETTSVKEAINSTLQSYSTQM